jgi:hypothetical protein
MNSACAFSIEVTRNTQGNIAAISSIENTWQRSFFCWKQRLPFRKFFFCWYFNDSISMLQAFVGINSKLL